MKVRDLVHQLSVMNQDFDVVICLDGIHSVDYIAVGAVNMEEMDEAPEGTPNNAVGLSTDN